MLYQSLFCYNGNKKFSEDEMKKIKTIAILLVIAAVLSGCGAYKEHSTKAKDLVGEWVLDSGYVNTHHLDTPKAEMVIESDYSGTYTEEVAQTTVNEAGEQVPQTQKNKDGEDEIVTKPVSTKISVADEGNGQISITKDGKTTTYRFNVDTEAGNLHLWEDKDGDEYHYVFIDKEVY